MKSKLTLLVMLLGLLICSPVYADVIDIFVTPEGDGVRGKDRYGYFSGWEDSGFISDETSLGVYHWYEDGSGSYRQAFLQFGLNPLSEGIDDITSISFNYNLLRTSSLARGYGDTAGYLYHVHDASAATGHASDQLYGGGTIETIMVGATTGWRSVDVTEYVLNDLNQGYNWSAWEFNRDNYAGMWLSAAESQNPAFLRIETTAENSAPVPTPEPSAFILLGAGLLGLAVLARKGEKRA